MNNQRKKLSESEIINHMLELGGDWSISEHGELERKYYFDNYNDIAIFFSRIAKKAEAMSHHPNVLIKWGWCKITLFTHDNNCLSQNDFKLAKQIESFITNENE